jgi:hypothetical protein
VSPGTWHREAIDELPDLSSDWPILVGVWADRTQVHRGRGEFTVDFIREVPSPRGLLLVTRAIVLPNVACDLRDQLDETWREYTRWAMPGDDS